MDKLVLLHAYWKFRRTCLLLEQMRKMGISEAALDGLLTEKIEVDRTVQPVTNPEPSPA